MHRCATTIRGDSIAVNMLGEAEIVCLRRRLAYTRTASLAALRLEEGLADTASGSSGAWCVFSGTTADGGSKTAALGLTELLAEALTLAGRGLCLAALSVAAAAPLAVLPAAVLAFFGAGFSSAEALAGESPTAEVRRAAAFLETGFGAFCTISGSVGTATGMFATDTVRALAVLLETGLGVSCAGSGSGETAAGVSALAAVRRLAVFFETGSGISCTGSAFGETTAGRPFAIVASPGVAVFGMTSAASRAGWSPWAESAGISTISRPAGKTTICETGLIPWATAAVAVG